MSNKTDTVMDLTVLIDDIAIGYASAGRAWEQAKAMGADPDGVMRKVIERIGDAAVGVEDMLNHTPSIGEYEVGPVCDGSHRALTATIKRLLSEAPAHLPGQAPAIECGVMFVGGAQFLGVLSETPEGGLRMLTQATNQGPGGVVLMAEQFFDYGDVMVIMIKREVKLESPSSLIIRS